jgi:DNA-binding transcriptional MocR family regulator
MSGKALAAAAREKGVQVSPGAEFTPESADLSAIRISVARGKTSEIVRALSLVGERARILHRAGGPERKSPRNRVEHEEALIQV